MAVIDSIVSQYVESIIPQMVEYVQVGLNFIVLFIAGYLAGFFISGVLRRILGLGELEKNLIKHGAMTSKLWTSIINALSQYVKWYITVAILTTLSITVIESVFLFMGDLFWFIILTIVGLIFGGILQNLFKGMLINVGVEEQLEKHGLRDVGGMSLTGILSGLVKWYVVLLFIRQGIAKLGLPELSEFTRDLMVYIPQAILGVLVILAALLIGRFVAGRIKKRDIVFSEIIAFGLESIIAFFGVALALPKFGITDVSILTDSFKIMLLGISLAMAIALGFGLKDSVSDFTRKYEKKL